MVSHPGTALGAHGLRPLGLPRTVARSARGATAAHAQPPVAVAQIVEVWRVAEAWWREAPLARTYVSVLLTDDRLLTLFHDDTQAPADGWFEQRY